MQSLAERVDALEAQVAALAGLPPVTEMERLALRPGDRLIVRLGAAEIDVEIAARVQHRVRAVLHLPADFPVLVTGSDADVEAVHFGEE